MLFFWRKKRIKRRYPKPSDYRRAFMLSVVRICCAFMLHLTLFLVLEHAPETEVQRAAAEAAKGISYVWYHLHEVWQSIIALDSDFSDAVWVTWATFTTVGYGDVSASTGAGRFITIVLGTYGIFQFGIFLNSLGNYVTAVYDLKKIFRWRWKNMKDHILVVGLPCEGTELYIKNLLTQLQGHPKLANREVLLMSENVPDKLASMSHEFSISVAGYRGSGSVDSDLEHCNVRQASMVFVICEDPKRKDADDVNASIAYRIHEEFAFRGTLIAEAVVDGRLKYMRKNGATSAVRVDHHYPGLLVSESIAPGIDAINRDAFQAGGMDTNVYAVEIKDAQWSEIANLACCQGWEFRGYVNGNGDSVGRMQAHSLFYDKVVDCQRVFIASMAGKHPKDVDVRRVLTKR